MALPEIFTPGHAAASLRLFVDTCGERSAELITAPENHDADGNPLVVESHANYERMLCLQMSTKLKEGRHYWFSPEVCDEIGAKIADMPDDLWEVTFGASSDKADWTRLPGATFMSFARPFAVNKFGRRQSVTTPGPLLAAALLDTGHLGFLSNQLTLDGKDQPLLKFMEWRSGESWHDLSQAANGERLQDEDTLLWAAGLTVAMYRGMAGGLEHNEITLPEHAHTRYMLMPAAGMFEVVFPDLRPYPIDGSTQARWN